ncbi:threonine ammonia-lyase [Sulfolobales archaeon HS-7]|nr:threonine ammonia-lyase [Sulfolobales archaeon HS-7]
MLNRSYSELFEDLKKSRDRIIDFIHVTPTDYSNTLSRICQGEVYLKLENLQKTGSFKVRGAFNKMLTLLPQKNKGVIAVSAGNHAQGVAYAANKLKIKSVIVMPENAPISKYLATREYGAEVVLYGNYIHESMKKAEELMSAYGYTLVHPYDDIDVVLGQGTISFEIAELRPDVVLVPIGGGGLISGISIGLRNLLPSVKIIGVQSKASPSLAMSKKTGKLTEVQPSFSIADGILVKTPSEITFEVIKDLVDDVVTVDDEEISEAITLLLERAKTLAEGAGAASVAPLISGRVDVKGKKVISLISGGNIDLSLLSNVIAHVRHKHKQIVRVKVVVPDKPGYLNRILGYVADVKGNVIEVQHDRISAEVSPGFTNVYVTFELIFQEALFSFMSKLKSEGLDVKVID